MYHLLKNKSQLFQFNIAFNGIWIILTQNEGGGGVHLCFFVEKNKQKNNSSWILHRVMTVT